MVDQGIGHEFAHGIGGLGVSSAQAATTEDAAENTPAASPKSLGSLQWARGGDGAAFAELVSELHAPLCTYLARMVGDDELGRDLAQETLIRAWTHLPELRDEQHFKAWLYRIATNLARSHLRRARLIRWLPWTQTDETSSPNSPRSLTIEGPEAPVGEADAVNATLARLSPQYRACLLLQIVGGFSQRDIARLLNISQKSVSSNVSRAREQFRHIYADVTDATVTNVTGGSK